MKHYFLTLLLIIFCFTVKANYSYLSLPTLVCNADYGAFGTIVNIDNNYFYLKVDEYLLGELEFDTLKIVKFESWTCGMRYAKYEIGQREIVFFRKSNYIIDDYELIGYGGGGEFELPILNDTVYYNFSYDKLKPYILNEFLIAIKDFNQIKEKTKKTSKGISKEDQQIFANKSELHKQLIEYKTYEKKKDYEIPKIGFIVNIEKNHLYEDYENKIYVGGVNIDSIYLLVEDADVWKEEQYFIVKPKKAWTRRFINVYSINDSIKSKTLFNQLFEVIELPEPRVYFGSYYKDTINIYYNRDAIPRVKHYLDDLHEDEFLNYELLSYTYVIKSGIKFDSIKVKSQSGTNELRQRISKLQSGDIVTIQDIYVLYPNNTVKQIKNRTAYVTKSK